MDPYLGQNLGNTAPTAGKFLGRTIGFMAGGPIGAAIGGKVGKNIGTAAKSIIGQASAKKLRKEAESLFPQYEDPRQLSRLAQLQQMQRSLETGTGAMTQAAKGAAEQGMAGTQAGIVRSTGGDVGSTIQGLLQSQRVGGENVNAAFAKGQEAAMQMNPLINALNNQIASRKMELQLAQSQQKRAEWAKMQQQVNQNLNADLARAEVNADKNMQETSAPEGIAGNMSSITQPGSSMESNNFLGTNRYSNMDRPPTPAFEEMGGENQGGNIGSGLKGFLGGIINNIKNKKQNNQEINQEEVPEEEVVTEEEQIQEEVPVKAKKKRKDLLGFLREKKLNKDLTWSDWQAMKAAEQEIE